MRLMREVRCTLLPGTGSPSSTGATLNTWAGSASQDVVGAFWALRAVVSGEVDEDTGYVCSLQQIDQFLRYDLFLDIQRRIGALPTPTSRLAIALAAALRDRSHSGIEGVRLESVELCMSPYHRLTVIVGGENVIRMTQSFEFSASHKLSSPSLNAEENRRVFGKCANPNGHGHNYVVEVAIEGDPDPDTGTLIDRPRLEMIVRERVIDHFDHKNLNLDCPEFAALNPSVENIAKVIWLRLEGALAPSRMALVRVWETPKTYAEYAGEQL